MRAAIREIREQRGLSPGELASATGVTRARLSLVTPRSGYLHVIEADEAHALTGTSTTSR